MSWGGFLSKKIGHPKHLIFSYFFQWNGLFHDVPLLILLHVLLFFRSFFGDFAQRFPCSSPRIRPRRRFGAHQRSSCRRWKATSNQVYLGDRNDPFEVAIHWSSWKDRTWNSKVRLQLKEWFICRVKTVRFFLGGLLYSKEQQQPSIGYNAGMMGIHKPFTWPDLFGSGLRWCPQTRHGISDSSWEEDGGHVIPLPNLPIAAQISQVFLGHRKPPTWSHLKSWQGKLEGSNRIQNGIIFPWVFPSSNQGLNIWHLEAIENGWTWRFFYTHQKRQFI